MSERNLKTNFSKEEYARIIALVRELETAPASKQNGIRTKIRRIGLYWSDVTPPRTPYTVANLQSLFESGTLRVDGIRVNNPTSEDNTALTHFPKTPDRMKGFEINHQNVLTKGRKTSDESYIIDLCDEILGHKAYRQHRFEFLRGDSGTKLPVDAYYPELNMVVEYYESQHTQKTPFFDKRQTVSGVPRGEQRKIYDQRRKEVLPKHGIKLVIISHTDLGETKKLKRNHDRDLEMIKEIFKKNGLKI